MVTADDTHVFSELSKIRRGVHVKNSPVHDHGLFFFDRVPHILNQEFTVL